MGHSWGEWTTVQGKRVNWGLRYQLEAMFKMLAHPDNGGEHGQMTIVQGCGANTVGASGGTHGGTGAEDNTAWNWRHRERVGRLLGLALWLRPALPGVWSVHMHGVTDGDGGVSPSAAAQIKAYHNRRNGLANNGPDQGYRMLVFPLFVFPEKPQGKPGRCWVIKAGKSYEQPTILSDVKKTLPVGKAFDVVAVVNVGGSYWGINAAAECFPMASLSRTAPFDPIPQPTQKVPAQIIDLTNQKVTLPTGQDDDPKEVKRPKLDTYSDEHFHANEDSTGVVFRAPTNGSHTENSVYSRSECREMIPGGGDEAEWNSGDGKTHKLVGTLAITEVPGGKPHVVAAQIHDEDDDLCMVRLEGKRLFVEGDGDELALLDNSYELGTIFDLSITANKAGVVVSYYNHKTRKSTMPKVLTKTYKGCYFKNGCYTQASSLVPKSSSKYGTGAGEVVYYYVKITHS